MYAVRECFVVPWTLFLMQGSWLLRLHVYTDDSGLERLGGVYDCNDRSIRLFVYTVTQGKVWLCSAAKVRDVR